MFFLFIIFRLFSFVTLKYLRWTLRILFLRFLSPPLSPFYIADLLLSSLFIVSYLRPRVCRSEVVFLPRETARNKHFQSQSPCLTWGRRGSQVLWRALWHWDALGAEKGGSYLRSKVTAPVISTPNLIPVFIFFFLVELQSFCETFAWTRRRFPHKIW